MHARPHSSNDTYFGCNYQMNKHTDFMKVLVCTPDSKTERAVGVMTNCRLDSMKEPMLFTIEGKTSRSHLYV